MTITHTSSPSPHARRSAWGLDLALLTLLCTIVYALGLTTHGLTNWQESQRALVVQEMHARGDWLVPTINNQPYLAKPPWYYWTQLALNKVLGGTPPHDRPGEFELRLSVAIGGTLGVLATYVVARRLARDWSRAPWSGQINGLRGHNRDPDRYARLVGVWSALMLATGVLYTRSSRIGELDIWIVPFAVTAIGAIHAAWRTHVDRATTNFAAVSLAVVSAIGAALAKGPPAVLPIATGAYGGIALWAAYSDLAALPHSTFADRFASRPDHRAVPVLLAVLAAVAAGIVTLVHADNVALDRIVGALHIAAFAAILGFTIGRLTNPSRGWACFRAYARTHPIAVLGIPALVLLAWGRLVGQRIGPENASAWAQKEAEDNLQILVAISPIKNLEAASYGVGLASIFAIVGLVWLWRAKPRMTPGAWTALAWVALSFAAYSMLGKGIARYLTPVWPGMAILAGMVVASLITERASFLPRGRVRLATILAIIVAGLAIGQSYWYGLGRELAASERSPRAVMRELLDPANASRWGVERVDRTRIGSYEYWTAATSVYAGTRVHPVGDIFIRDKTAGGAPMTLDELRASILSGGPWILFIRERQPNDPERVRRGIDPDWMRPAIDRLREAGFVVTPLDVQSRWVVDGSAEIPYFPVRVEVAE